MRPQKSQNQLLELLFFHHPTRQNVPGYWKILEYTKTIPQCGKETSSKGMDMQRQKELELQLYQPYQYFTAVTNSHRCQDILCCQMVLLFCSTCCAFFFRSEHICCDFFQYPFFLPCNLGCEDYKAINQNHGEGRGSDSQTWFIFASEGAVSRAGSLGHPQLWEGPFLLQQGLLWAEMGTISARAPKCFSN